MFFAKIFRALFFLIDKGIHWLIVQLYTLFETIASTEIFESADFEMFSKRIYAFVGIFMLFRVTFSLITYLVNPDKLNDQKTGVGKLVTNVVMVLVLVLFVPTIFSWAMNLQQLLLKNQTVDRLILGIDGSDIEDPGSMISWQVFSTFLYPDDSVGGDTSQYGLAESESSMELMDVAEEYNRTKKIGTEEKFVYTYQPILAVVFSGFTAYLLLTFCVQIAVRTVKLGFLQLIAPIPIISYVDPKSSQNGAFSNWVKLCISTYFELFIRIAALSFVILIVGRFSSNLGDVEPILKIFLLLGALVFAQQAPKLLTDMFGMKGSGDDTSKTVKGMLKSALGIGAVGAAATGAIGMGMIANGVRGFGAIGKAEDGFGNKMGAFGRGLLSMAAGGISAGTRVLAGYDKKGGLGGNMMRGFQGAVAARDTRGARREAGISWTTTVSDNVKNAFGFKPSTIQMERDLDAAIAGHEQNVQAYSLAANDYASAHNMSPESIHHVQQNLEGIRHGTVLSSRDEYEYSEYLSKIEEEQKAIIDIKKSGQSRYVKARQEGFKAKRK